MPMAFDSKSLISVRLPIWERWIGTVDDSLTRMKQLTVQPWFLYGELIGDITW